MVLISRVSGQVQPLYKRAILISYSVGIGCDVEVTWLFALPPFFSLLWIWPTQHVDASILRSTSLDLSGYYLVSLLVFILRNSRCYFRKVAKSRNDSNTRDGSPRGETGVFTRALLSFLLLYSTYISPSLAASWKMLEFEYSAVPL
jgi:hypothetical protein